MVGQWIRLLRQPFPLLLLLAASLQQCLCVEDASHGEEIHPEIPRGPAPQTMFPYEGPLPLLRGNTLFVVDNEPVVESHIVSNLLHQLLYTIGVPQDHIRMRDEAFLLGDRSKRLAAASLGRWLASEAESMPEEIEFVFVCTAYTRIDPRTLEALLKELKADGGKQPLGPFILAWALVDEKSTIIHHFAAANSQAYPHLDAGSLWSRAAFVSMKKAMMGTPPSPGVERDFVFELFLHLKKSQQLQIMHSELFCPTPPVVEDYERAYTAYPAPHTRPRKPVGDKASAAINRRELSPAEAAAATAAAAVATVYKGCAAFFSGTRHAPVLSHQMFDALIDFDEELMVSNFGPTRAFSL